MSNIKRFLAVLLIVCMALSTACSAVGGVKKITLSDDEITLNVGDKYELEYSLKPNSEESRVTWKSSDENVAKVSSKGVVTAKGPGSCEVTATTKNGRRATCTVYVNEVSICGTYELANNDLDVSGTIVIVATSLDDTYKMSYSGADIITSGFGHTSTQISTDLHYLNYVKTTDGMMCYDWLSTDPNPDYYFIVYEDDENFESIYFPRWDGYMYRFDRVS